MKIQLKRYRLLKFSLLGFLLLVLLFSLFSTRKSVTQINKPKLGAAFSRDKLGNFEPEDENRPDGPGENGKPHYLPSEKTNMAQKLSTEYGMNIAVSDEIAMDRSIPDTRIKECKHWNYPTVLPKATVVLVFHNEGFSTLMRTVHSVINRSPPQFLQEVLLVDDYSDKEPLKENLEAYIKRFGSKVRLVRNLERQGLIRSRTRGAKEAYGEVVVFLDAHCEVNKNWLPPLLTPIHLNESVMTVPVIDGINHENFEVRPVYEGSEVFRGIFEWGMLYKENDVPAREKSTKGYRSEPYRSPTHAGGLFAINREYFLHIGAYDPGLLVWGGENFELSFKIWQCGGAILWVPCSRVAHVYRGFMPYNFGKLAEKKKGPLITTNYKRVIEVWFDEPFKEYFYTREPLARYLDMGDISEQLELKNRLQCKSFDWFMTNVAYDVYEKFPKLPPNAFWGELHNVASGEQCFDTMGHSAPSLMGASYCHGFGTHQLMRLNTEGQLGVGERCIDADNQGIKQVFCRLGTVDGPWLYDSSSRVLQHKVYKKCVALHPQTNKISLMACDMNNNYQKWFFKEIVPNW